MTWRPFETTPRQVASPVIHSPARRVARAARGRLVRWALLTTTAVGSTAIAGCGTSGAPTVDVLAASSFTDVAEPLEALLETELDVDIRFSFGSSGSFLEQIDQGAPAAIVITADTDTMRRIEAAGLVEPSVVITRNELIIVTADTDAGRAVTSLADLADAGAGGTGDRPIVVVCTSSAPCGAATDALLATAGLELSPASREPNVRATLTKVLLGEADAAIVYRTDALAHPELRSVEVGPDNIGVVGRAAAVIDDDDAQRAAIGGEVLDVLTGERAAALFAEAGFTAP